MLQHRALQEGVSAVADDACALPHLVGQRVGNYVIERPLARGGMGSVFVAKHPQLGREVAVKFLSQQVSAAPEHAQRFLSEARITANLKHPHIVDILDFGELDGRLYYVMELLRGRSLRDEMRERGRFPLERAARYLTQVCSALEAAHGAGVVHRDLKPGNIFIVEGEPAQLKLLDFGVAKLMSTPVTRTRHGQVLGTPTHMAPEQALGDVDRTTPQSDLYSLGVIAYELLTGEPLFRHESELMLLVMHVRDAARPIRELAPEIHERVAALVERCLAKDPSERPASARALAEELAAAARFALDNPITYTGIASELREAAPQRAYASEETISQVLPAAAPNAQPPREPAVVAPVALVALEPAPVEAAAAQPEPRERVEAPLSATAQSTLNKLLLRLQRRGDFPAFAQAVGEVTKKADADSAYSASELGQAILQDYALTAKLLRIVNSMYANRFGGKIYSVQHAIVLLGFDRVRSLALSISLFKRSGKGAQAEHVSDSAIGSIATGQIARSLARNARVSDEEAMVCAMFRDLGRHLVIVYLPELYAQIVETSARDQLSLRAAAERVLGTSFWRLGLAVAQNWRLPPRIVAAISAPPYAGGALPRVEDRLSALAEFSSELCELVASETSAERERALSALLSRHSNLVALDAESLLDLLSQVRAALHERYSKLLGLDVKASRFLNNLAPPTELEEAAPRKSSAAGAADAPFVERIDVKPIVRRLNFAKVLEAPRSARERADLEARAAAPDFEQRLAALRATLVSGAQPELALNHALALASERLAVSRLLLLTRRGNRDELVVRAGIRDDLDALVRELHLPLKSGRGGPNVFAHAFNSGRDVIVSDAFDERQSPSVPLRYIEALGSPAFAVYSCVGKGLSPALLLVDADSARELPAAERVAELAKLRPLLAQAAAR